MKLPVPLAAALPDPLAFDAVLFDMDGTLVDSEPIWFAVLRAVVTEFGGDLPEDAHEALHGNDRPTTTAILRERYGLAGDTEAFWVRVMERLVAGLAGVRPMPNAGAWVEAGSLVTRDVPAGARVLGNPAQIVGTAQ